ncbi:MAG: hypothetical protein IPM51_11660 [Sphingobacteriaceae bacterium]|nr:hypothetical protein [Sphingobacteriaceae bacterium]
MGLFDKEMFQRANANRQDFDVEDGTYLCELIDAEIAPSKGQGKLQMKLQWKISPDDPLYGNRNIFQCVGLEKDDDVKQEKAYEVVAMLASILGIKDMESFSEDPNMHLLKCIGSEARITLKEKDGFQNIRINKIIHNTYDPSIFPSSSPTTTERTEEQTLTVGTKVLVATKDGQKKGKVAGITSEEDIQILLSTNQMIHVTINQLELFEWEEEKTPEDFKPEPVDSEVVKETTEPASIEEAKEIELLDLGNDIPKPEVSFYTLKEGENVSGVYKDETYTGTIHKLDEAAGLVFIRVGNKAIPCNIKTIQYV